MQLNFTMNALLYDTSEAYYKCTFTDTSCGLKILFPKGNVAVLTSPGPEQVRLQFSLTIRKMQPWKTFIQWVLTPCVYTLFGCSRI